MTSHEKLKFPFSLLQKIRPIENGNASNWTTLFGWYARKGVFPIIRGTLHSWRFKDVRLPFFLGKNPSISYARQISLGSGVYLGANITILAFSVSGVHFKDRVTIRENGWIQCSSSPTFPGEGLNIGAKTYIGPSVTIGVGGPIRIGSGCMIGAKCTFISENHATNDDGTPSASSVVRSGIRIGNGCWIGHGVTIVDGVILGDGCIVGAGAVVTKSFPTGSRIAGVPAHILSAGKVGG